MWSSRCWRRLRDSLQGRGGVMQIGVAEWSLCLNKLHVQFCREKLDHIIDMSDQD